MKCAGCGRPLDDPPWGRHDECAACGASLHACVQCGFYAPGQYNECREVQAERVLDKEAANFCDYFKPADGAAAEDDEKTKAKVALDALFKK